MLAPPVFPALYQRPKDGDGAVQARVQIPMGHGLRPHRLLLVPGGGIDVAHFRVNQRCIGPASGPAGVLPVAADGGVDEPRIQRRHCRVAKPQLGHDSRAEVFYQHVRLLDQRLGQSQPLGVFGVDRDVALSDVLVHKAGRKRVNPGPAGAQGITVGRLRFHHVGAHIHKYARAVRARKNPGKSMTRIPSSGATMPKPPGREPV